MNEQLKMKESGLPGQKLTNNNIINCWLLIVFFSLLIVSCDLFTGPKTDLFQQISDEVDWANAPKLTVRINYPSAWGTSNPPQGSITPARDIRKGYEFSVEFTPDTAYTLRSWHVFRTSDLDSLGNWLENPALINPKDIEPLGPGEVTLPEAIAAGGAFNFTIHTTEPVTIVPWCDTQPRITRTEPRSRPDGLPYSRASDIVLYFNSALNAGTVKFADAENADGIWITAKSGDNVTTNKANKWFYDPEYSASGGFFTITMNISANLPPANSLMTVTVKGIKNAQGDSMDEAGYSFSWNTSSAKDVYFNSWSAEYIYNDKTNSGNIKVLYNQTGANENNVKTYYRLNNGANVDIIGGTISNVPGPDVSGVRGGRQVGGIREYAVFIELYAEGIMESRASFKIWNIPGMSINNTNQALEIKTAAELAAMKNNLGGQYVLANDIAVTGEWTPVGEYDAGNTKSFRGKFYGNGHTITFNSDSSIGGAANNRGLFGYVQGPSASQPAVIRDLTFEYDSSAVINVSAGNSDYNIGGVAGYLKNTTVRNIITSGGNLAVNAAGAGNFRLGGIAGYVENGFIANCRAGLNVKLTSNSTGACNVGVVAGFSELGSGGGIPINIGYTNPKGKGPDVTLANLAIDGITVTANVSGNISGSGGLNIGGAAGYGLNNTMRDIIVSGGGVSFDKTNVSGNTSVGGVIGYANNLNMEACSYAGGAVGTINKLNDAADTWISLGGLIGNSYVNSGDVYINKCLVRGNVKIEVKDYGNIDIGGVLGNSIYEDSTVTITDSFFEEGNITAVNTSGSIQAGGFCGIFYEVDYWSKEPEQRLNSHYTNNCGAMAGTLTIDIGNYGKYTCAGGFTSQVVGSLSNCFSRANVVSRGSGNSDEEGGDTSSYTHLTGGFTGMLNPDSKITSCYATGTVRSVHNGNRDVSVGGLVGLSLGTIENCYALGDVLADKTTGESFLTCAGGLVGTSWGDIRYSFSAGQVFAQSAESRALAGGVVGYGNGAQNTAALGGSVAASGPLSVPNPNYGQGGEPAFISGSEAGRIIGLGFNLSDNYANYKMLVGTGEYQKRITAREVPAGDTGIDKFHGEDITIGSHTVSDKFWRTTIGLGSQENGNGTMWDFSTVVGKGYPVLKGLAGQ